MFKKKIVIIDDEIDLCHLMKTFLSEMDYEVHMAHTLNAGLDMLQNVTPDVIFMDNNLLDGLGWQQLRQINRQFPACKINLISAYEFLPAELPEDSSNIAVIEKPLRLQALKDYL